MEFSTWLVFAAVALLTAFTPGPGVLLAVSNAVGFGVRAGLLTSLGNAAGLFLVSGAATIGLGAVLKTSATLFTTLKILGAIYLIYLGVRQWRSRSNVFAKTGNEATQNKPRFPLQGFLLAPTNPKAILFLTALLPQFMKPEQPIVAEFLVLTSTFAASTIISHVSYMFLARRSMNWFSTDRRVRTFNRASGSAFMLLGAGMFRLRPGAN